MFSKELLANFLKRVSNLTKRFKVCGFLVPDSWETFRTLLLNSAPNGVISVELAKNSVLNKAKRKSSGSALHLNDFVVEKRCNKRFCSQPKTEEQKRKEKEEAHLYTIIKIATDQNLHQQIGKTIFFDLVDHDKVRSFRIKNQTCVALFQEEVAKELGIPVQHQRFWLWAKRQNKTYRPIRPLPNLVAAQSVGFLRKLLNKADNNSEINLILENSWPVPHPPTITKDEILLFLKLYDPSKEELRFVGRVFVKVTGKPIEILTKLNELAGYAPDEEIELFEEIKFEPVMCEYIDKNVIYRDSQLENGDIICFQKPVQVGTVKCRYPDVRCIFMHHLFSFCLLFGLVKLAFCPFYHIYLVFSFITFYCGFMWYVVCLCARVGKPRKNKKRMGSKHLM